jgi:MoxR-like ATPase
MSLENRLYGQETVIRQVVVSMLAGGHVLVQGVPGVGKTRLARTLTSLIGGTYRRIQFTPDLMPSDVLGNAVFDLKNGQFEVHPGPIFANVILADEINRTPPKTQSALLEAMEERQVSIYGETRALPCPFFVLATQNPIEYEGTYPLPEAQLDRFMMQVIVDYPNEEAELDIILRHGVDEEREALSPVLSVDELLTMMNEVRQVNVSEVVAKYIVSIIRGTRNAPQVYLGASPRAGTALADAARAVAYMEGRTYVIPDDVLEIVTPVLRHRLVLYPNAELEGVQPDAVVRHIVESVEVPR